MTNAKLKLAYQNVEKESGQVRFLAFLSYIAAIFLAWQAQFFTVSSFVFLSFHHLASPLSIVCTFFQRGEVVAIIAVAVALLADVITFSTSLISVVRCFYPDQASLNCPDRLIQGSWLVYYAGQHAIIGLLELLSLQRYSSALQNYTNVWENHLASLPSSEARKRAVTDAKKFTTVTSATVDRRLHIFALVPTGFYWLFCAPFSKGWLAIAAGARLLRDAFGIWLTLKSASGSQGQTRFFHVFSIVVASLFLLVSLAAWLYSEELADPTTISWDVLLDGAHSAYTNPWDWSLDGLRHMTEAAVEPFLLTFVFIEVLILANKYSPVRG